MATTTMTGFDVEIDDAGVAMVTLRRPGRKNGTTLTMKRELTDWLVHASADDAIRVIVLTGDGDAFCAGDDITGKPAEDAPPVLSSELRLGERTSIRTYNALRLASQPLSATMRRLDKITIAAVNGVAVQSGLTMALACDMRIAARSARFSSGTLRFALTPDDGGHVLLVRTLGLARALMFVLRNEFVDAEEALACGLVTEVVDDDVLMDRARELALEMAALPQVAARMVKRSLYIAEESTFERALEDIAVRTALTDYHQDAQEGMAAFRERRTPEYNRWLSDGSDERAAD